MSSLSVAHGRVAQQAYDVKFDAEQKAPFTVSIENKLTDKTVTQSFATAQEAHKYLAQHGLGDVTIVKPSLPAPPSKNLNTLTVGNAQAADAPRNPPDVRVLAGAEAVGLKTSGPPSDHAHGIVSTPPTAEDRAFIAPLVRDLQTQLNRAHCNVGKVDGDWGKHSAQGLAQFHAKHELDIAMHASVNKLDREALPPGELAKIVHDKADHMPKAQPKAKVEAKPEVFTPKVNVSGESGSGTNWFVTIGVDTGPTKAPLQVYCFPNEADRKAFLAEVNSSCLTNQTDINQAAGRHHDKQFGAKVG